VQNVVSWRNKSGGARRVYLGGGVGGGSVTVEDEKCPYLIWHVVEF
jgi:hypothetical protein